MNRFNLTLVLIIAALTSFSQGNLMLVGGGGEGNWSDPAYSWAINQAENKRVAIISYNEESQALPDYFLELGAAEAINIQIDTRTQSEHDTTFTYLMGFDCFFFKGGDQSNYYRVYKSSKVTEAINAKYLEGGVISGTSAGMAILSSVIYSADRASVFPDQVLNNINDNDITLHNDFVNLLPGYTADTHFIERGRAFRLMGFIARWFSDNNEVVNGIGVDDQTAFCIDKSLIGTTIGTGAVSLYFPKGINIEGNNFSFDSLASIQLIDSNKYDLINHQIINIGKIDTSPTASEETGNFIVFLSGSNALGRNVAMLTDFRNTEAKNDTIVLVTSDEKAVGQLELQFEDHPLKIVETSSENNHTDSTELRNWIRKSAKVIFYLNQIDDLSSFISNGPTGELLKAHLRRNEMVLAFIGDDSNIAGHSVVTNNIKDPSASYRKRLTFEKGLGVLDHSFVLSNAIDRSTTDYYENNTSAVLFELADQRLKYGFYINSGSYLKISPHDNKLIISQVGSYPSIIVTNESKIGGKAKDRNLIGIDLINYQVLIDQQSTIIGTQILTTDEPYTLEPVQLPLASNHIEKKNHLYPNPAEEHIFITGEPYKNYYIFDFEGKLLKKGKYERKIEVLDLKSGIYILQISNNRKTKTFKFYKR